ncbi:glycosyltransferase family 4 protein (plasmid) [Isosphaeraceae bacterium EP7]
MKIAIASSGLGHVTRGIESWASDLAGALDERGVPVVLFKGGGSPSRPFERVNFCLQRGDWRTSRIHRLTRRFFWRFWLGSPYEIEQVSFSINLLHQLRKDHFDILHVSDPVVALLVQKARALGLVRTRAVLSHGTNEPSSFLARIHYLQHLAPWHLEQAAQDGVFKSSWSSIPNFVDTERFRSGPSEALRAELNIPNDGLVVLSVAAIKRDHKRIDYLLEEFADLLKASGNRSVWLVVAGGWETDTDDLVRRGQETLGDRVRFLVRFPRDRIADLYRLADVFVLCSLREMMPLALLEAVASGLPCLVNRHPVLQWMIGPGGEPIDMARRGALAAALRELLGDDPRRKNLGRLARDYCLMMFDKTIIVGQHLDYYRSIVDIEGS